MLFRIVRNFPVPTQNTSPITPRFLRPRLISTILPFTVFAVSSSASIADSKNFAFVQRCLGNDFSCINLCSVTIRVKTSRCVLLVNSSVSYPKQLHKNQNRDNHFLRRFPKLVLHKILWFQLYQDDLLFFFRINWCVYGIFSLLILVSLFSLSIQPYHRFIKSQHLNAFEK